MILVLVVQGKNTKNVAYNLNKGEQVKILKNAGSFEVLSKPENVIKNIATAARTCYQTKGTPESDVVLVKRLVDRGHTAMLEFGDMTVQFNNLSRGFTHELVRHRLCSYAQESTRFVDESGPQCCCPS